MKKSCGVLAFLLSLIFLAGMATAADDLSISSVSSAEIICAENEDTILLRFTLAAPESFDEITVILATEEISGSDADSLSKILCIDQMSVPANGEITLRFSRAKLETLIGTTDFNASALILYIGEKSADAPAMLVIPFPASEPVDGDINGDGKVTVFDALEVLHALLNNDFGSLDTNVADVNGDGKVSLFDVLRLLILSAAV